MVTDAPSYRAGVDNGVRHATRHFLALQSQEKQTVVVRVRRVRNAVRHTHQYVRAKVNGGKSISTPVSYGHNPAWESASLEFKEVSLDDNVQFDLRNQDPLNIMPVTLSSTQITVRDLVKRPAVQLFLEDVPLSKKSYKNAGKAVLQNVGSANALVSAAVAGSNHAK